jgi:hypothetical protein
MAVQLGLVTTKPPDLRRDSWHSKSLTWSALTSGMTRGTSGHMRQALELVMTKCPAAAKRGSNCSAAAASKAAKMSRGAPSGEAGETGMAAAACGTGVFSRQRAAWA